MQREDYREESIIARPGETHIVRGETHIVNSGDVSARSTTDFNEDASPEEIRAEIESTRTELSSTIDAIQEKLAPEVLKEHAMDMVREVSDNAGQAVHDATIGRAEQFFTDVDESIGGAGSTIVDTIKQNPIPSALLGIGLGWLLFNRRSQPPRRHPSRRDYFDTHYDNYPGRVGRRVQARPAGYRDYYEDSTPGYGTYRYGTTGSRPYGQGEGSNLADRAGETVGDVASRAGDVASRAGDTMGDVASRAGETVGDFADEARDRARQAGDTFQTQLLENPLAMGAIALGIGAAVGLAAPSTGAENRFMGKTRDRLMGQAQHAMEGARDKVQHVVDQAGQAMQENVEQAGSKVGEKIDQAGGTARQAVQQAGSAAQQAGTAGQQAGSTSTAQQAATAAQQAAAAAQRAGNAAQQAAQNQQARPKPPANPNS